MTTRVGVYGASGSGKTSFFRHLIQGNGIPVPPKSKLAQFMIASVGPDGRIVPTTEAIENLDIRIGRNGFLAGDWGGDLLSASVDRLDMEHRRGRSHNLIARQIARSDVFLFFFNPAEGKTPQRTHKHHRDELLRAKQLIDYILESRQNLILPILFIVSHQDRLTANPELARLTDQWIDDVYESLEESYDRVLQGFFPKPLVRKEHLFHRIAPPEEGGVELPGILEQAKSLAELDSLFRRRDRKRSRRLVASFIAGTLLFIFAPLFCLTSAAAQKVLFQLRDRAAPVLRHLPLTLSGEASALSEGAIDLTPLFEDKADFDDKTSTALNRSLFLLMKRLNKLEDDGRTETDDYRTRLEQWTKAFEILDRRFKAEQQEAWRENRKRYETLLADLTDSPNRTTVPLNELLRSHWQRSRQVLLDELRNDLAVNRAAGTPSATILNEFCRRLERAFRDVSESNVRGDFVSRESGQVNQKETLKQDIRTAFIACRNYADRYPVEIKILSATYASTTEIDRDYVRRLVFYGGKEKNEVEVDLSISTGFDDTASCDFLPSRKDITVSFAPDNLLRLSLQQKHKGSGGEWERVSTWEISSEAWDADSLAPLGIQFYLRHENEENTRYVPEDRGYKFELVIRRPRSVPELLWQLTADGAVPSR